MNRVVVLGLAALSLLAAYTLVFGLTTDLGIGGSAFAALVNTLPLILCAWVVHQALQRFVLGRAFGVQIVLHWALALVFAVVWYTSVIVIYGWMAGDIQAGFTVSHFQSSAFVWQMYQGVTLYAVLAATTYAMDAQDRLASAPSASGEQAAHLLLRTGDEMVSVPIAAILWVAAADDHAEVHTADKTYLTRRTLTSLERVLPTARFVRVHRSSLVNLDAIARVESAGGGCLLVHVQGRATVKTSRAGAQRLRALAP